MANTTVADLALELSLSIAALIDLLRFSGVRVSTGSSTITSDDYSKFEKYLCQLNGGSLDNKVILWRDKSGYVAYQKHEERILMLKAKNIIDAKKYKICSACDGNGNQQKTCLECNGTRELIYYEETFSIATCTNMSSTCPFCGGTGVGRQKVMRPMRVSCNRCKKGKVFVTCIACSGTGVTYKNNRKITPYNLSVLVNKLLNSSF
jgi:hypothetical protein